MRTTIAIGLTLALAAFAPPERAPAPLEPSQQQAIPKSWVPEKKTGQSPPITLGVTPRAPSAYSHGADLVCAPGGGPQAVPKEFVNAYQAATTAARNNQFAEAVRQAEIAAAYAKGAREWNAIEQIRILCFERLGNDHELIASIEAALASKDCLNEPQTANLRQMLEEARRRLDTLR
jgi:hypothetical protein